MKFLNLKSIAVGTLLGVMALSGCTRSEKNFDKGVGQINNMPGEATIAPAGATTERDAYVARTEDEFAKLENRLSKAKGQSTSTTQPTIDRIEGSLGDIRRDLQQMKTVSLESYQAGKAALDAKLSQAREDLNRIVAE